MTREPARFRTRWLAPLALAIFAVPVSAQVPQDMTFSGRLVDGLGLPVAGPVDLTLRIFDADTLGTELYSEAHLAVALDATGGFSVQLGLGTSPSGPFDADLFSAVDRWLEVEVDGDVLIPRQILGSVPWALVAERANELAPDPNAPRFEDCGDGTVADHQTGLRWEKKTTTGAGAHDVDNLYAWSSSGTAPDGAVFTTFLAALNGEIDPDAAAGCFADHCDWRLPRISELQTIMIGPEAAPGQAATCSVAPCVDPDFAAVGGPTPAISFYWSGSTSVSSASNAWIALFFNGEVIAGDKMTARRVRAVRDGTCL